MMIFLMYLIMLGALAAVALTRSKQVREHRAELGDVKLDLAEARATIRGVELTVRENRVLGDSAGILADLVIDKVEQYETRKLRVELGLPLEDKHSR